MAEMPEWFAHKEEKGELNVFSSANTGKDE
jgi:hypothetical protein